MYTRGRTLKFTAVIALVVLALTGFSTGRHHGSRHKIGSGGGGCSSSRQDHDSYDSSDSTGSGGSMNSGGSSSTRRPTHRATPTSSGTGGSTAAHGTARLLSCATEAKPYASVEVGNPNGRQVTYWVDVTFKDAQDNEVVLKSADVKVPAKGRATVKVHVHSDLIDRVDHCEVNPEAYGS